MSKGRGYLYKAKNKAQKAVSKGNKKAFEKSPTSMRAQLKVGSNEWVETTSLIAMDYFRRKHHAQAESVALELDKNYSSSLTKLQRGRIHSILGVIALQKDEFKKAAFFLESAKENLPNEDIGTTWPVILGLIDVYKKTGKLSQAIKHLTDSIEIIRMYGPDKLSTAITMLSNLYKENNEPDNAKQVKSAYFDEQVKFLSAKPYNTPLPPSFPPNWGKDAITHLSTGALLNEFRSTDRFKSEVEKVNLAHAKFMAAMNCAQYFLINLLQKQMDSQKINKTKIVATDIQFTSEELLEVFFCLDAMLVF